MELHPYVTVGNPLSLSIHRRFATIVLVLMAMSVWGAIVIRQSAADAPDLLAEYTDIFPGQSKAAVEARGFDCIQQKTNYYSSEYATCNLTPPSGTFSAIEIQVDQDKIVESRFWVRGQTLQFGDLMLSMEMTNTHIYPNEVLFFWHDLFVTVQTSTKKKAAALRPIYSITITEPGLDR